MNELNTMNPRIINEKPHPVNRIRRLAIAGGLALAALCGFILILMLLADSLPQSLRRYLHYNFQRNVKHVEKGQNVVDCSLAGLDLRNADLIQSLRFNLNTRWPTADRLPPNMDPGRLLTNAMNPGLGVRELHQRGITGEGVSVAIIDYRIFPDHPEYARQLTAIHDLSGQKQGSMHGPAVASLLAGAHCGTAPKARLFFVVTPDPGNDVKSFIAALDWIMATNASLPPQQKIRVVSISASPEGDRPPSQSADRPWLKARTRAEQAGIMVLDASLSQAFIGPCSLDPMYPEDPAKCRPIPAQGRPDFFTGHLLAPVSPRTTAEQYYPGRHGYQYCGPKRETYLYHGVSWAVPYCAGVLALGWQIHPSLTPTQMREYLVRSAHILPSGEKVIDPKSFIALIQTQMKTAL